MQDLSGAGKNSQTFEERTESTNVKSSSLERVTESPRLSLFSNGNNKIVLINTAIIFLTDANGKKRPFRAILDCASESSFITTSAAQALNLRKEKINIPISGLNDTTLNIKSKITTTLCDKDNSQWTIDLLLVPKITESTPAKKINISNLNIPVNIQLADPKFFMPQKIDVLLGAELFFAFIKPEKINLGDNLFLQSSCFGYLISGSIANNDLNSNSRYCFLTKNLDSLEKTLTSFWETEEVENNKTCTSEELKYCNQHFADTHYRKPDGKYVVEMPFKPECSEEMLGRSKEIASKRLNFLWKRLERDPALKKLYTDFLHEYERLQHMEKIEENSDTEEGYYIPHHGVLRPSSKTTKCRVVFNASTVTSSGLSLNDLLCKGGLLQEDLFSILIRFRKHLYAFTTDIKQMFRMIEINPAQTNLQKILWKDGEFSPTKVYKLKTVTYGTASAPYLATKVLQQLAIDEREAFPLASKTVLEDFYMDDCLSGSSNLNEFKRLKQELTELLQRGQMSLHKCCSNEDQCSEFQEFSLDRNSDEITTKTLGMHWNSSSDTFTYKVSINSDCNPTKRDVLSQIARLYDPLGLLGPVIAKAKIFMQQLWLLKLDWHETLPPDVCQQWETFTKTLPLLQAVQVPRCFIVADSERIILHGFADASSKAYGAVLYLQSISNTNESQSSLMCSKSRVAPTKTITIPRLELSACLLLAKLAHKVMQAIKLKIDSVFLWTDSTIALAWIDTAPHLLKTFVSNRVAQIKHLSKDFQWHHVPSDSNPADAISRGLDVKALIDHPLWWNGPDLSKLMETATSHVFSSPIVKN